jgi:hypothetical protein
MGTMPNVAKADNCRNQAIALKIPHLLHGHRSLGDAVGSKPSRNFCQVFRELPQGISTLHSFRTAGPRILIAEPEQMRESAITAGVNDTLPVIAKAGSAVVFQRAEVGTSRKAWVNGKPKGYATERCPNAKALWVPRALRPPQRTVSPSETATGGRDQTRCTFECAGALEFRV